MHVKGGGGLEIATAMNKQVRCERRRERAREGRNEGDTHACQRRRSIYGVREGQNEGYREGIGGLGFGERERACNGGDGGKKERELYFSDAACPSRGSR
jgi:hypothetical protein